MIDLQVSRKQIDEIDSQIVKLFEERMKVANEVFCHIRMILRILKKQKKRLIKNRQKYIILACLAPIHSRRWKTCLVRRYRGSAVRVFRA